MRQPSRNFVRLLLVLPLVAFHAARVSASLLSLDPAGPAVAHVTVLSDHRGETVLEFRMGTALVDTQIVEGELWTAVTVSGTVSASRSGWPEVPQLSVWIQTASPNPHITILEDDTLHRNWGRIIPAAEPQNRSESGQSHRSPDAEYYGSDTLFPLHSAEISLSGGLSRAQLVLLTFSAVQFDPRTAESIIHTRIRVRISGTGHGSLDQQTNVSMSVRDFMHAIITNPDETTPDTSASPKLILVTESRFLASLQPFVMWKRQSGIPVMTLLYSQVANSALSLRTHLRQICDSLSPPPGFLLIVGDVDSIPAFYGVDNSLTDHPYGLLTDADYLPDISVGRIPCQTVPDCDLWVNRLLAYERDAVLPNNFTASVTSSAAGVDSLHGVYVSGLFQNAGMTAVDHFQAPTTAILPLVLGSLNSGRQWVFYIGHGLAQSWSSIVPALTNSTLDQVTAEVAPIVISVACATADLDYPGTCFAKHWLDLTGSRGPLAYFGATENTAFYRSDTIGIGALRAVFLHNCERLGTAADFGRLATAQCFPQAPGGLTEETIQQFELLADPSMRVFSSPPEALTVTAPVTLAVTASSLLLTVERGNNPFAGALVCIESDSGNLYKIRYTDSLGQAVIPLSLSGISQLYYTVTAHNTIPVTGEISVVSGASGLVTLGDLRVLDTSGDNDGLADRSESCALRLSVFNSGNVPSSPCIIHVSREGDRVLLSGDTVSVPSVSPHDTLWLSQTLPFTVSDSISDLDVAMLRFSMSNSQHDSSIYVRPLILHAPILTLASASLLEDSGNGNGNPEAGERLALQLRFVNTGSDRAVSPVYTFTTSTVAIHIQSIATGPQTVMPGDTLVATAYLFADTGIARGYAFDYGYELSAANYPAQSGVGTARIGQVPVFLYELDPMPDQIDAVEDALASLGVEHERAQILPADLSRYSSVWIFCGIFPNTVSLSDADAAQIAQYLDAGGNCYWEGGDVWAYDPVTPLHPYFHIQGTSDGSSDAGPVQGANGTSFFPYRFDYAGENSFIDRLAPADGAVTILRNVRAGAAYPLCVAYAGATYRTVGCSIELGSLVDSEFPDTRVHLFKDILAWFGIQSHADIYPPVIRRAPISGLRSNTPDISILADIQDAGGIAAAELHYRIGDGAIQTTSMLPTGLYYRAGISRPPDGTVIRYTISASDNSPAHNTATTPEFVLESPANPERVFGENFAGLSRVQLAGQISSSEGCSWSLTSYPMSVPVLELHAAPGKSIRYQTNVFDGSHLQNPEISFWVYLREVAENTHVLARVSGSTDGGTTFPHQVWEYMQKGGGVLDERAVEIANLDWMRGQSSVVLRFEFFGSGYMRLRDISVANNNSLSTLPVRDLVISVASSDGIQLTWSRVTGATRYAVYGTTSGNWNSEYNELARISDTTWTDLDDRFLARYYQVVALIGGHMADEAGDKIGTQAAASLRLPDLKWNRRLQAASSRIPSAR
jgi:hypothetical protein